MLATFVLAAMQITHFDSHGVRYIEIDNEYLSIGTPVNIAAGHVSKVYPSPDHTKLAVVHYPSSPIDFIKETDELSSKTPEMQLTIWDSQTYQSTTYVASKDTNLYYEGIVTWSRDSKNFYFIDSLNHNYTLVSISTQSKTPRKQKLEINEPPIAISLTSNGIATLTLIKDEDNNILATNVDAFDKSLTKLFSKVYENRHIYGLFESTHPDWLITFNEEDQFTGINLINGELKVVSSKELKPRLTFENSSIPFEKLTQVEMTYENESKVSSLVWELSEKQDKDSKTQVPIDMHGTEGYVLNDRRYIYYQRPEGVYVRPIVNITKARYETFHARIVRAEAQRIATTTLIAIEMYTRQNNGVLPTKSGFFDQVKKYVRNPQDLYKFEYFLNGEQLDSITEKSKTPYGIVQTRYGTMTAYPSGQTTWTESK